MTAVLVEDYDNAPSLISINGNTRTVEVYSISLTPEQTEEFKTYSYDVWLLSPLGLFNYEDRLSFEVVVKDPCFGA